MARSKSNSVKLDNVNVHSEESLPEFQIDDETTDGFNIDEDDDDIDDLELGNQHLEYYPDAHRRGHTLLGDNEDFKYKLRRIYRNIQKELSTKNSKKLLVGLGIFVIAILFFAIMFFTGNGSDAKLPGGAIHDPNVNHQFDDVGDGKVQMPDNNNVQNDNNDQTDTDTDNGNNDQDQTTPQLAKMSLDDMRKGNYWVFDYQLNFIDFDEGVGESVETVKRDHDDDHDDDDDDDHDDDDGDDDEHENKKKGGKKDHDDGKDHDKDHDDKGKSKESNPVETQNDEPEQKQTTNTDKGFYLHNVGSELWLRQGADPKFNRKILDLNSLTYNGVALNPTLISVTKSLDKIIVYSDSVKQWRHSSYAKYWLVDVKSLGVEPVYYLSKKDNGVETIMPVSLSYAAFTPDNKYIYFNYENNLMLRDLETGKFTKVTKDGSLNKVSNGKPDWVYEEEVLGSDRAIYWDTEGSKFAFIQWDDDDVPVYNLEIFGNDEYPKIEKLRYPKPGFKNPKVSLYVYNIEKSKLIKVKQPEQDKSNETVESLGDDFIIYQTVWLNDNELLFKRTDRTSRKIQVCVFNLNEGKTTIVRSINTDKYNGWYKNNGDIFVLPNNNGYIDTVVYENHDHLSHFKTPMDSEGDLLTGGEWDVIGGVSGFDESDNSIYFIGTAGNALQRQVYKVGLNDSSLVGLTKLSDIHSYSLKVSRGGKYAVMKYAGPGLPTEKIVELSRLSEGPQYYESLENLNNANSVATMLENYSIPSKEYKSFTLHDGVKVNVVEIKPANFDENKSYPLLVSVYGGPGIQKVSCDFSYGFEEIVASSLDAVVLYIDPRGTGGLGWDYRSYARNKIGYWEPRDITETTEMYANDNEFIDISKIGVWGWSYGGFTTLKTLEYDQGRVFKYGMAVAPVTNWKLYDSIYTERYLGNPEIEESYQDAKIENIKSFEKLDRFLIMHGTADDNVHYQNTLQLLNQFDINGIENYDVHVFTDSDHSIAHDNANTIVYDKLFSWIAEAFGK